MSTFFSPGRRLGGAKLSCSRTFFFKARMGREGRRRKVRVIVFTSK